MMDDQGSEEAVFDNVPEFYFHTIRVLVAQIETMLRALEKAKAHPKGDALLGAKLAGTDTTLHQRLEQFDQLIAEGCNCICGAGSARTIAPTLEDHLWNLRDWRYTLNNTDPDMRYGNIADPLSKVDVNIDGTEKSIWLMEYFDLWLTPNLYLHLMGALLILSVEGVDLGQSILLRCYNVASPDEPDES